MTAIDQEVGALHVRYEPSLVRLAVLANRAPGVPLPPGIATEVTEAAGAILAQAAADIAVPAAAEGQQAATHEFLAARLSRLEIAADAAVAAARSGDLAALRNSVRRLATLTTAMCTVQQAINIQPDGARGQVVKR